MEMADIEYVNALLVDKRPVVGLVILLLVLVKRPRDYLSIKTT